MEPMKSSRFSVAACLQAVDVFLDVVGHVVEGLSELADFRRAFDGRAFVEFGAADGARGANQPANGPRDSERRKISEQKRDQSHRNDEAHRLRRQFLHAGVNARLCQAALRDHRPAQLGNRAVGADHFDGLIVFVLSELGCFRRAYFFRHFLELHDDGIRAEVTSGDHVDRVRMDDDSPVYVDDEDGAVAHACIFQTRHHVVERHNCRQHSRELAIRHQRNGNDEGGTVFLTQSERITHERQFLHACREGALQRRVHERIAVSVLDAFRRLALGVRADGRYVENVAVVLQHVLEHAAKLRRVRRIADVLNPAREREQLSLAFELFAKVRFELQNFAGDGARDFRLLQALGVLEFFFAELEHFPVIQP